ncbi:TPA: chondroitinase family polysaccharide lyase [Vibrio parahaemolyticus]
MAATNAEIGTPQILSFEDPTVYPFVSSSGANLTVSSKRSILGAQSLKWSWQANETLTIDRNWFRFTDKAARKVFGADATQTISFWMYNEKAVNDFATLELSDSAGTEVSQKKIRLNYKGWRMIVLSLNNDFGIEPVNPGGPNRPATPVTMNLDKIQIQAPTTGQGRLFIDRFMLTLDDSRYQWSDKQVTTSREMNTLDFNLPSPLPVATQDEIDAVDHVKSLLINEFKSDPATTNAVDMLALETQFADYGITKNSNGVINGDHILTNNHQTPYQIALLDQQHLLEPNFLNDYKDYIILGDKDGRATPQKRTGYASFMMKLARSYHNTQITQERDRIAQMYLLLTEHLLEQGFAKGSAMGATHHWGYSGRWWYISALMMEQELTNANLNKQVYEALEWFSSEFEDRGFSMELHRNSSDMDYFNTLSRQQLAMIALNPDEQERVALMKKYSAFISEAVARTPVSYYDGFRPDGTAWRHKGHYNGYAFSAFTSIAHVAYMLKDTDFALTEAALNKLRKAMVAGWISSNPHVPLGLSGRNAFSRQSVKSYAQGVAWLAQSYPALDKELASIYLQIEGLTSADALRVFGEAIQPAQLPEGSWSFNGGAFAVHRYGDRMALIKGYNQEVWSAETYATAGRYSRYQSHGSVHVIPYGDQEAHGFVQEGWDWNRNVGATTIHVDWDILDAPKRSLRITSDTGLAGGASLENQYTGFGFKHQAPIMKNFESTFVANKYVMGNGKFLYMTGDGISNQDGANRTETTLFQLSLRSGKSVWVDGIEHTADNLQLDVNTGSWIIDDNNVGYYLVNTDPVKVFRGNQESRHGGDKSVTQGDFSVAWIDHGVAPQDAGYEYIVVMDTTPGEMTALAASFQQQARFETIDTSIGNFHVTVDKADNLYSYTAFDDSVFNVDSYLKSIDVPSQTMIRVDDASHTMKLSTASLRTNIVLDDNLSGGTLPDADVATLPVEMNLVLTGEWAVDDGVNAIVSYADGNTHLIVESFFAMPVELTLYKKELPLTPLLPAQETAPNQP